MHFDRFLDFLQLISWHRRILRPLTQPQFSTQKLKGQAINAQLSFVQLPMAPQYLSQTIDYLFEATEGRQLVANVDHTDSDGTLYVTLLDPKSSNVDDSINADLVQEGLAHVPTKLKAWERVATETIQKLKKLQAEASEGRRGIFEYGDLLSED